MEADGSGVIRDKGRAHVGARARPPRSRDESDDRSSLDERQKRTKRRRNTKVIEVLPAVRRRQLSEGEIGSLKQREKLCSSVGPPHTRRLPQVLPTAGSERAVVERHVG